MIVEVCVEKMKDVLDFAWNLYCQKETSSYRRYENKQEMEESFIKAFNHPDDKVLAVYTNDMLAGVLNLSVEKNENYLQTRGVHFPPDGFEDFNEMIEYIKERYAGFELLCGYPKDAESAISFIQKLQAECIESSLTMVLKKEDLILYPSDIEVVAVTPDMFEQYAAYHDAHYTDNVYWTASRIKEKFWHWKIYMVIESGVITGAIHIDIRNKLRAEIFGLSVAEAYTDSGYERALLSKSLTDIFASESISIMYMIEDFSQVEIRAAEQTGFKLFDTYVCYKLAF